MLLDALKEVRLPLLHQLAQEHSEFGESRGTLAQRTGVQIYEDWLRGRRQGPDFRYYHIESQAEL